MMSFSSGTSKFQNAKKQVFLALLSNRLTIQARGFYETLPSAAKPNMAGFEGINELNHQISQHIAAIGLAEARYPDDVLWNILHDKAACYQIENPFRWAVNDAFTVVQER